MFSFVALFASASLVFAQDVAGAAEYSLEEMSGVETDSAMEGGGLQPEELLALCEMNANMLEAVGEVTKYVYVDALASIAELKMEHGMDKVKVSLYKALAVGQELVGLGSKAIDARVAALEIYVAKALDEEGMSALAHLKRQEAERLLLGAVGQDTADIISPTVFCAQDYIEAGNKSEAKAFCKSMDDLLSLNYGKKSVQYAEWMAAKAMCLCGMESDDVTMSDFQLAVELCKEFMSPSFCIELYNEQISFLRSKNLNDKAEQCIADFYSYAEANGLSFE